MRKVIVENINKIRKAVPIIEGKMKIKLSLSKDGVLIKGTEYNEFQTDNIIRAIDFGFHVDDALLLKDGNFVIEFIEVKEHTYRKNLKDVRARLIGKEGKARKTIENLTGAVIVINGNDVGIIVDSEHLNAVTQAIQSIIHGARHGNVFSYLEKQNASRRQFDEEDLGLRKGIKK